MSFGELAAGRLRGLYPDGDPRFGWLPEDPAAAEAHLRDAERCDLVVGYTGERFEEIDRFVRQCLAHRASSERPDLESIWSAFLDVGRRDVLDAGIQLSADQSRVQLYLRGNYDAETTCAAFEAAGLDIEPRVVRNALALFGLRTVEMIGLELGEEIGGAVYLSPMNASAADTEVLTGLIEFLVAALLRDPGIAASWRQLAPSYLQTPGEEFIFVSFEPTIEPSWVKIDVSSRPLALISHIGKLLELDVGKLVETATRRQFDDLAHVGVRFTAEQPTVSLYHSIL